MDSVILSQAQTTIGESRLSKTVLVVEDEAAIREMIVSALERAGFAAVEAENVEDAYRLVDTGGINLILLDWMLPGVSGLEFARRLKRADWTRNLPIVMVTARGEENDRVSGLEAGIDDYIIKPFSLRELIARINAVLRRASNDNGGGVLQVKGLSLDPTAHRVTANGTPLRLGPTEFRLLHFFMVNPERVFGRSQLLDSVWGTNVYVEERTVDVHIRRLRKNLSPYGLDNLIQTVHGAGYRFSKKSP